MQAFVDWFRGLPALTRGIVIGLLFGSVFGGCVCRSWRQSVVDSTPPPDAASSFGWRDDPAYVERVVATFQHPFFGDTAKQLIQATEEKDAFLWQAYEKVTGHAWRPHNQNPVGSCVGHGASGALELLAAIQQALGEPHEYQDISAAAVYAFSREVGDFLGNQDGSTGADAAKAMMTMGSLSCKDAGDDNVDSKIGAPLCKKWGKSGVPQEFRPKAAEHKVKTASRIRFADEARVALSNGYPITIASNVGFNDSRGGVAERDSEGKIEPRGNWPHQMFVGGYRADKQWFLVFQSWGGLPHGPKALGQPDGTFWITKATMQRIVSTGEAYALSGFNGFPAQDVPLFIRAPMPRREFARRPTFSFDLAQ